MSVRKRGKVFYIRIRPLDRTLVTVRTPAKTRSEAERMERQILTACQLMDFRALDASSRAVCIAMFRNRRWEIPPDLGGEEPRTVTQELTLWRAAEIFLNYPSVRDCKAKDRYVHCLTHLVKAWGKDKPVKEIRIPDIRLYQTERIGGGASPSTVNWEKSTLSRVFQTLIELEYVQSNPARQVKNLSQKSEERQVYLSLTDATMIAEKCPEWFRPILWTAFYTGMRLGEIVGLTRKQVDLSKRMIYLGPQATKEGHWKRIPIHRNLIPMLEQAMRVSSLESDRVFLLTDDKGTRVPTIETVKNCWPRALEAIDRELTKRAEAGEDVKPWPKPWPRFHDLRAAWRSNARRSGVDPQIAESILGHRFKGKSVNDRYGYISDSELIQAIDRMTFDHGKTHVWIAKSVHEKKPEPSRVTQKWCANGAQTPSPRKKATLARDLTH